jgi:hypothetical protein
MSIRTRLKSLERAMRPVLQHTCGPMEYAHVYAGEDEPTDPPSCGACEAEARRTGHMKLNTIIVIVPGRRPEFERSSDQLASAGATE